MQEERKTLLTSWINQDIKEIQKREEEIKEIERDLKSKKEMVAIMQGAVEEYDIKRREVSK